MEAISFVLKNFLFFLIRQEQNTTVRIPDPELLLLRDSKMRLFSTWKSLTQKCFKEKVTTKKIIFLKSLQYELCDYSTEIPQ